jgi:hypothetical protein
MSKSDLTARPVFHHVRHSIEAYPSVVFAVPATSRRIKQTTGSAIGRVITIARRRYRTITIQAGAYALIAADPVDAELQAALEASHSSH